MLSELTKKILAADLNGPELKLFSVISDICSNDSHGVCKVKNIEFAQMFKVTEREIEDRLSKLRKEQMITSTRDRRKGIRYIRVDSAKMKQKCWEYAEMSEAQKQFQDAFPGRLVNAEVPDTVDMPKLIEKIKQAGDFFYANISLRWFIKNYDTVMKTTIFETTKKNNSTTKHLSKQEINTLFQA